MALNPPHDPSSSPSLELYDKALLTIWELFREIKLCCIHVADGLFGHLGTSSEFLDLICSCRNSSSGNSRGDNKLNHTSNTSANTTEYSALDTNSNHKKNKSDIFSIKYNLQSSINSRCIHYDIGLFDPSSSSSSSSYIRGVTVNSLIYIDVTLTERAIDAIPSIGSGTLIEHSILLGACLIGSHCIISHIYSPRLGQDLVVNDNMMLQQVPLLPPTGAVYEPWYVVVLLGLHDDVKASYSKGIGTICGVPWTDFFQVLNISVYYCSILYYTSKFVFYVIVYVFLGNWDRPC